MRARRWWLPVGVGMGLLLPGIALAASTIPAIPALPTLRIGVGTATSPTQVSQALQILFLLTVLSLAPAILILMTSFTRIVVVLSFLRSALGTQNTPPNQVLVGFALFLTFFTMAPVWNQMNTQAVQPYLAGKLPPAQALTAGVHPLRDFMFRQTDQADLGLFVKLAKLPPPKTHHDVPTYVLIPAFVTSELKIAFEMGFLLFLPFMVIDMVVASTLMSMGMFMLPPMMISMPFKILLFVLVDGWALVVQSLVSSFH
ncbi:MAG: flagellar type III secretion system pore protein FliP [Thermaerobacter sp.]|nr:flagellar type III secretion system pore protein FliP [Thermaerobacter sp.]